MLNAIFEEDFLGFSYGFRPGRGTHDALDALVVAVNSRKVNYILDADIQSFFREAVPVTVDRRNRLAAAASRLPLIRRRLGLAPHDH